VGDIVFVYARALAATPSGESLTGGGGTWTEIGTQVSVGGGSDWLYVYRCTSVSSPSDSAVTFAVTQDWADTAWSAIRPVDLTYVGIAGQGNTRGAE